jgi:hypothetical protein
LLIRKRIASGSLTDEDLVQAVADYYPRVVALCSSRLAAFGRFQTELKKSYREILRRQIYRERTGEADRVCRILKRTAS